MKPGLWLKIENGRIDMIRATMRLCVDREGTLELLSEGPEGAAAAVKARLPSASVLMLSFMR